MTPTPSAAAAHRTWAELTVSVKERDMDGVSSGRVSGTGRPRCPRETTDDAIRFRQGARLLQARR